MIKIERNVKIRFMTDYIYDDSFFVQFSELVLPLNDAIELVNDGVAVIDYVYEQRIVNATI